MSGPSPGNASFPASPLSIVLYSNVLYSVHLKKNRNWLTVQVSIHTKNQYSFGKEPFKEKIMACNTEKSFPVWIFWWMDVWRSEILCFLRFWFFLSAHSAAPFLPTIDVFQEPFPPTSGVYQEQFLPTSGIYQERFLPTSLRLSGTVPANKWRLSGKVPANKWHLSGTVPTNKWH